MSNETSSQNLSSSFGWPKLPGSNKQSISDSSNNIDKHKNRKDASLTNETGLNTIKEASNEISAANSLKTSLAISSDIKNDHDNNTIGSNWWFLNGKVKEDRGHTKLNGDTKASASTEAEIETEWAPYKKMSSAISYYYSTSNRKYSGDTDELMPLLLNNVKSSEFSTVLHTQEHSQHVSRSKDSEHPEKIVKAHSFSPFTSWISWFGVASNNDDSDESLEGTSDPELFKQAKLAIENSRDSSHYAFKSSTNKTNINDFELAVSDTKTENKPVKHRSKKRPITPNEAQEKALQQSSSTQTTNGSQIMSQHPTINSSSSSITSAQLHNGTTEIHLPDHCSITPHIYESYRIITLSTRLRLLGEPFLCYMNTPESHIYSMPSQKVHKRRKGVKKVVIIGVHGFLPTKMVKTLIGQSTGSSVLFINEAVKAMTTWLHENETQNFDYDIQTIALEGEGIIEDRVDKLYKLLENWTEIITNCDFLFMAAHALGAPVAIYLLARLIENYAHLSSHKKIGLLAMSGIFVGPIAGLNSKLVIRAYSSTENQILNELFEFQKPNSEQSVKLVKNMQILVNHNVKLTFCGSIDDQFVPIFSSTATNFDHPNLFKCVFIDNHSDVPKFIISLIKIILIMKNLGYSDHNLLRDLSDKCLGSLPDGGHGKIFNHEAVYLMAIRHSLETTDLVYPKELKYSPTQNFKLIQSNHFHIPWNIRGLLNDLLKIKNVPGLHLINILIKDFREWNPTQKKWKDLKYCFDAFEEVELEDLFL